MSSNNASKLKAPSKVVNAFKDPVSTIKKDNITVHSTALKRKEPPAAASASRAVKAARTAVSRTTSGTSAVTKPATRTTSKVSVPKENAKPNTTLATKKRPAWDYKGRLLDIEEEKAKIEADNKSIKEQQELASKETEETRNQLSKLQSTLEDVHKRLQEKEVERDMTADEASALKRQMREKESAFEEEKHKLVKQHEEEVLALERKVRNLDDDCERLNSKVKSLDTECSSLKSTISIQAANELALKAQMTQLEAVNKTLEKNLSQETESRQSLESRLEEARRTIEELEIKIREEEIVRRRLHNTIQELKGNIRVFCRVRPLLEHEISAEEADPMGHLNFQKDEKSLQIVQAYESAHGKSKSKEMEFSFDRVFPPTSTQAQVFEEISQLVQSACDGYNVCIFAYGQTGAGKTMTMEGPPNALDDKELMGMIPRSVVQIWEEAKRLESKGWSYVMEGSFVEIYNETVRDLLGDGQAKKHDIKHDPINNKTTVTEMTMHGLTSPDEVISLLKIAAKNRSVGQTMCNDRSSRSHSVFMMRIAGENANTGEKTEGMLNLIDLAGSERLSKSEASGDRLKETQAINKSLSALATVFNALSNNSQHIPYRDSKLTYLLQNSLGGNSKTLMFVNVNPSLASLNETICSLRFATNVNNCHIGTARKVVKQQ